MLELLSTKLPKLNDFSYIQLYMERLLPLFTLNEQLWILYCGFADDFCNDQHEKLRILRCSLKNCYSNTPLWVAYLLELEKLGTDIEEIEQVVGQAKQQASDQFSLDKYMHGLLSRRICGSDEDSRPGAIKSLREFYEEKFL